MIDDEDSMNTIIQNVLDKPPRHDPHCAITAQVMSQIASQPQRVHEEDMSWVYMALGVVVLIGLAVVVDYFLVGDWQSFTVIDGFLSDPVSGQATGFPFIELCCGLLLIPLLIVLLGRNESFEHVEKDL